MKKRPGGELAARPLHFIWLADCSGSMMVDGKIQALNNAIREAIPHMQRVADENPNADVFVRAAKFSNGAQWHIPQPTPVQDFKWHDLEADGVTDMGKWASTAVLKSASAPASQTATDAADAGNVPIPAIPASGPTSAAEVW